MTLKTKMAFALLGVVLAASACGSTASAASKTNTTLPSLNNEKPGPCDSFPGLLTVPKTTPATPTASSCWADGMYVGNGSLKSKEIIFASKEAELAYYETTSAMFANPTQWAAWEKKAQKYMSSTEITKAKGSLALLLTEHKSFSLPPGNPVVNSGLQQTDPAECQSSVVVDKNKPSPQYLVEENNVTQAGIINGKSSPNTHSWTDVMAKVGNSYIMVAGLKGTTEVPSCAG